MPDFTTTRRVFGERPSVGAWPPRHGGCGTTVAWTRLRMLRLSDSITMNISSSAFPLRPGPVIRITPAFPNRQPAYCLSSVVLGFCHDDADPLAGDNRASKRASDKSDLKRIEGRQDRCLAGLFQSARNFTQFPINDQATIKQRSSNDQATIKQRSTPRIASTGITENKNFFDP